MIQTVLEAQPQPAPPEGRPMAPIYLFGLALLFLATGCAFGVHAFLVGHHSAYNLSREVPWGLLIVTYVFLVTLSTGFCLVASLGHLFGIQLFMPLARRASYLSLVTLFCGFFTISFEIENFWRMVPGYIFGANPSSNIWWMGILYGIYIVLTLVELRFRARGRLRTAGILGLVALVADLAALSNLGAVFGLLSGHPYWYGPYLPIFFIVSAATAGCIATLFSTYLSYGLYGRQLPESLTRALRYIARLTCFLLTVLFLFMIWKVIAGLSGRLPGIFEATYLLVAGSYAPLFWVGELILGLLLPFALLLQLRFQTRKAALCTASACALIGLFIMRYDLIIVGQLIPHFNGMGLVEYPEYFSYIPSLHEAMIALAGLALCTLFYLLGERRFHHSPEIQH